MECRCCTFCLYVQQLMNILGSGTRIQYVPCNAYALQAFIFSQGCASDVATHFYSYSRELNPDWKLTHVYQPDLKAYWKRLATKHDVLRHIRFNTKVLGAQWDVSKQVYRIELVDVQTGKTRTEYANALVSAIGSLDVPHFPEELKGIRDAFKGEHFHSARWDHSVSLRNKRVAVIGNGCSALVFICCRTAIGFR